MRTSLERGRRKTKAREELHRQARGLDRNEVDGLIDQIWPAFDLPVPSAHERPSLVDRAMGTTSRIDDLRTAVDMLEGATRWISGIVRKIRDDSDSREPSTEDEASSYKIRTGRGTVEVDLDSGTQPRLAGMADGAEFVSRTVVVTSVELHDGPDGTIEVWDRPSDDSVSPMSLGRIAAADAPPYRMPVAAATRVGQTATCRALRLANRGGGWSLYVMLPIWTGSTGQGGRVPESEA